MILVDQSKIFITGASGNTGGEVLRHAVKAGASVRAGYQSADKAKGAPAEVEAVVVDFMKPGSLLAALEGVERVFLVGPAAANLVELERSAMDDIRRSGVRQVVKLSAMGPREAIFPGLHRQSEDYIRESGIAYTFLRPNGFMQNVLTYNAGTIKEQSAFYGCQGDGKVSLIDLRDIAAAAVKTLMESGHEGKTYTLTGPEAITNADVAAYLSEAVGREIRYVDLPEDQVRQAMLGGGMPEWTVNSILDLNRLYKNGGASEVSGDVEKLLGRKPATFRQFAKDYAPALGKT